MTTHPDDLEDAVERLIVAVDQLRAEMRRRTYALVSLLVVVVMVGFGVTQEMDRRLDADHARWCPVAEAIAPRPGDPPPAGNAEQQERAQRIRDTFEGMRRDWC